MARKPINKPTTNDALLKQAVNTGHTETVLPKDRYSLKRLGILLAVISFLVYANTLQNGYVADDATVITSNTIVTKGLKGIPELLVTPRLKGFEQTNNEESYRPLPLIMYAIEYQVFGAEPAVGHLVNIITFMCCVIALFVFLHKLLYNRNKWTAFCASLLFAVHPVHTEVVANIKSRDELLCFLFAFLSLNIFIDYARHGKFRQLAAGAFALFLSFLSKETSIAFLFIIPLVFFFYINESRKRSIYIAVVTLLITLCFLAIRGSVLKGNHISNITFLSNPLIAAPDFSSRLATAITVLGVYMKLLFIPYPLICDYSYNSIPAVDFGNILVWISLAIYLFPLAISIYRVIKFPKDPWAFGILFFLTTIALFSNIPFLVYSEMAERFLFFASAGFCLLIALAFELWIRKSTAADLPVANNKGAITVFIAVCVIFFMLTIIRNADWKDNQTLFSADLKKSPNDCELYFYVATGLSENLSSEQSGAANNNEVGRESINYLNQAIAIYPDFEGAHAELGRVYNYLYMFDSGIVHDNKALLINPSNSIASYDLAMAYYYLKQYPEAITFFKRTISLQPGTAIAYINLGRCYSNIRQYDSAIQCFNKTLALDPQSEFAKHGREIAYYLKSKEDSIHKSNNGTPK